jgi:hypothetical protein
MAFDHRQRSKEEKKLNPIFLFISRSMILMTNDGPCPVIRNDKNANLCKT